MEPFSSPGDTNNMDEPPLGASTENGNGSVSLLRFLVSNATAGSVIGKGGATITELQAQSGARIQLSRNHEYFPGTTDRVVVVSGTIDEMLTAFKLILSKMHGEAEDMEPKVNQVKLVVPHIVCGAIIGKGGATIRALAEDSHAIIKLSPPEQAVPGSRDRLVTVTGTFDEQLHAVSLITTRISEDANYAQYASSFSLYCKAPPDAYHGFQESFSPAVLPLTYGTTPYMSYQTQGMMPPYVAMHGAPLHVAQLPMLPASSPMVFTVIAVPDECVGALVGRGGKTILDIQQNMGVHIRISDRGDFVPGTTNRKVTISGSPECVYAAQQFILQKLSQNFVS